MSLAPVVRRAIVAAAVTLTLSGVSLGTALTVSASAGGIHRGGPSLNGPSLNGPSLNGPSLNGPSLNGPSLN